MRADLFGASGAIRGEDEAEFAGEEAELEEGAGDGGRPVEMNEEEAVSICLLISQAGTVCFLFCTLFKTEQ